MLEKRRNDNCSEGYCRECHNELDIGGRCIYCNSSKIEDLLIEAHRWECLDYRCTAFKIEYGDKQWHWTISTIYRFDNYNATGKCETLEAAIEAAESEARRNYFQKRKR